MAAMESVLLSMGDVWWRLLMGVSVTGWVPFDCWLGVVGYCSRVVCTVSSTVFMLGLLLLTKIAPTLRKI